MATRPQLRPPTMVRTAAVAVRPFITTPFGGCKREVSYSFCLDTVKYGGAESHDVTMAGDGRSSVARRYRDGESGREGHPQRVGHQRRGGEPREGTHEHDEGDD